MEFPIGSLVVTDEIDLGDKAVALERFVNNTFGFFPVSTIDMKLAKEGKKFVKLVYDTENFCQAKSDFPVKQLNANNVIEYMGQRYKLTSSRGSSVVYENYLGDQEDGKEIAKLQGLAQERDGVFVYDSQKITWINEKTVVKLLSIQAY